ncbi:MAG: hypothetical protein K6E54_02280 [Bacteroidaceae bacterium]|nr:hypothetical protein [Bacteroidaceae bacterium]
MIPPRISTSSREERMFFVRDQWKCLDHCPSCGKCHILKGKDAEQLYADYIEGIAEYIDITKKLRDNK